MSSLKPSTIGLLSVAAAPFVAVAAGAFSLRFDTFFWGEVQGWPNLAPAVHAFATALVFFLLTPIAGFIYYKYRCDFPKDSSFEDDSRLERYSNATTPHPEVPVKPYSHSSPTFQSK